VLAVVDEALDHRHSIFFDEAAVTAVNMIQRHWSIGWVLTTSHQDRHCKNGTTGTLHSIYRVCETSVLPQEIMQQ
jgi:hypothetical protein